MSRQKDDPHHENPDSCPTPDDDSLGMPVGSSFPPEIPTRGFPDSFAELHGDVRKGQRPPEEKD